VAHRNSSSLSLNFADQRADLVRSYNPGVTFVVLGVGHDGLYAHPQPPLEVNPMTKDTPIMAEIEAAVTALLNALTAERLRADEAQEKQTFWMKEAERFAGLVETIQAETVEACAKIADGRDTQSYSGDRYDDGFAMCAELIAQEIRAFSPTAPMTKGE